jgi:hypothetical protein
MATMPRVLTNPAVRPQATVSTASAPLRRCTFRYVKAVTSAHSLPVYEIACTFPDRKKRIPLGDVESARPVCEACTYQGIFRPDSD